MDLPSHSQAPLTVYLPTTPRQRVVGAARVAIAKMMSSVADWECFSVAFCQLSNLKGTDFVTNFAKLHEECNNDFRHEECNNDFALLIPFIQGY